MAIKFDMEQAYDRIEWDFLTHFLISLGFHNKWINWIKECVQTVSIFVLFNDYPTGYFHASRGLRKGALFLCIIPHLCGSLKQKTAERIHE